MTRIIHLRVAMYVLPENATRLHAALGASDKDLLWITGSGHVVTRDAQRGRVFEAALKFIQRVESSG